MEAKRFSFSTFSISLLFLISAAATTTTPSSSTTTTTKTYQNYIETSCASTTYPKICYKSLFPYSSAIKANPENLCKAALNVTLSAAKSASKLISKLSNVKGLSPGDSAALKDCRDNIKDSVDELKDSLEEMGDPQGQNREFQEANVRTWASAAMTDEDTCLDDLSDGKVSALLKKKVGNCMENLVRMTSNFLALMNNLKY